MILRPIKENWHSDFDVLPHIVAQGWPVPWLSLSHACVAGHDLALQPAELHLQPYRLLPTSLLPAPQPLLRPAGQGH